MMRLIRCDICGREAGGTGSIWDCEGWVLVSVHGPMVQDACSAEDEDIHVCDGCAERVGQSLGTVFGRDMFKRGPKRNGCTMPLDAPEAPWAEGRRWTRGSR